MADKDLTRTVRLTKLIDFLSLKTPSGGVTVEELTQKCGVSDRQIYRDLKTLEEQLEVNIVRPERGQGQTGRYKLDDAHSLKIGPEIAAAVFLSMLRQKGSPLAPQINETKDTLIAALFKNRYSGQQKELEQLQRKVYVVEEQLLDLVRPGEVILRLMDALKNNNVVTISHFSQGIGGASSRVLEPYGITSKHNTWYVVGYCQRSQEKRTFRIDLIEKVTVHSDKKFCYPEDFSLQDFFGDSWGIYSSDESKEVRIKVSPKVAYRFKRISYHPSQKVEEELEDGSLIVYYKTSGLLEFRGWILGMGNLVEILEPQELRHQMKQELEKLLKKYK